jgi:hypothetical protein
MKKVRKTEMPEWRSLKSHGFQSPFHRSVKSADFAFQAIVEEAR